MNIALFGYGKMGKEIEAFAIERGHQISARIDSSNPKEEFDYSDTDAIIEFSRPEFAGENIRFAIDRSIPIAIGTTGWYEELDALSKYCDSNAGTMLHATNFSVGVNAFFAVNQYLARIMNELKEYSAEVVEIHHTEKLDAPSGTGISLAEQIITEHQQYNSWENNKPNALENKEALSIESLRLPKVPGTHEIKYTSEIDTIEIKHTAHNRKGFAQGSVLAAEWLIGKKGVFTMQDVLKF
jgi:4-hydroxy-tetrahydrodipicolinate reductase